MPRIKVLSRVAAHEAGFNAGVAWSGSVYPNYLMWMARSIVTYGHSQSLDRRVPKLAAQFLVGFAQGLVDARATAGYSCRNVLLWGSARKG